MSYGLDLLRLPPGEDPAEAYRRLSGEQERRLASGTNTDIGPLDPEKENQKMRLATALIQRHPTLELVHKNYQELARLHSMDVEHAKRHFRQLELNDTKYPLQILLFDDAAGASLSHADTTEDCRQTVRLLWDCLELLEKEGGFSTYDPQVGKLLDLRTDLPLVLENACGIRN